MTEPDEHAANALTDMFYKHFEGTMLTRFVLMAEVVDANGEESVWTLNSPGMAPWTMMGYLQYGLGIANAAIHRVEDSDEGD